MTPTSLQLMDAQMLCSQFRSLKLLLGKMVDPTPLTLLSASLTRMNGQADMHLAQPSLLMNQMKSLGPCLLRTMRCRFVCIETLVVRLFTVAWQRRKEGNQLFLFILPMKLDGVVSQIAIVIYLFLKITNIPHCFHSVFILLSFSQG